MENTPQEGGYEKGYSKRPLWQWIAIYVVVGGIVYALGYYFFFYQKDGGYTAPSNQSQSNSSQNQQTQADTVHIAISNYAYNPITITIHKGQTVVWENQDSVAHTVTGDSGGPSSGYFNKGDMYSYTFDTVGTFAYHCIPHPYMKAVVTVTE